VPRSVALNKWEIPAQGCAYHAKALTHTRSVDCRLARARSTTPRRWYSRHHACRVRAPDIVASAADLMAVLLANYLTYDFDDLATLPMTI
jgi:hypothetical protein